MWVFLSVLGLLVLLAVLGHLSRSSGNQAEEKSEQPVSTEESPEAKAFKEPLWPLYDYLHIEGESSLERTINWLKASRDAEEVMNINADDALGKDLTNLIRGVSLAGDIIRQSDAEYLIKAARFFQINNFREHTAVSALRILERYRLSENKAKWSVPTILSLRENQDLPRIIGIYIGIAEYIANHPDEAVRKRRQLGFEAVRESLNSFISEAPIPDNTDLMRDMRRELLGVEPHHSPEELKAAYHRAAALWHPDKLAHLAPELRSHAEVQMKAINEAYESLRAELGA